VKPLHSRTRKLTGALSALLIAYVVATAGGCMNPSMPSDLVMNLPRAPHYDELEVEGRTLVVLQHGMWRSSGAMWRLARALRAHGYEVLNTSYPSTRASIEEHAERLASHVDKHLARVEEPYAEVWYVGHSMGGLVLRTYLGSEGALPATGCVFVGTPQRGATLAELDQDRWWFQLFLGNQAARQLRPSDPFQERLAARGRVPAAHIGVLYGGKGDEEGWNARIPGDDDGTVGASEARLAEATDTKRLRLGHTRLSYSRYMIHEVLHFLSKRSFLEG